MTTAGQNARLVATWKTSGRTLGVVRHI